MTREGELEAVRLQGKRIRTTQFEVRYLASPLRRPRVGVIVPKFGHTAVERNLVKRRLRTIARTELLPTETPCDVVLRASPNAYGASYDVLCTAMRTAMKHLPRRAPDGAS